jgi:hypothetical protein
MPFLTFCMLRVSDLPWDRPSRRAPRRARTESAEGNRTYGIGVRVAVGLSRLAAEETVQAAGGRELDARSPSAPAKLTWGQPCGHRPASSSDGIAAPWRCRRTDSTVWHCAQRVLKRAAPFFASPADSQLAPRSAAGELTSFETHIVGVLGMNERKWLWRGDNKCERRKGRGEKRQAERQCQDGTPGNAAHLCKALLERWTWQSATKESRSRPEPISPAPHWPECPEAAAVHSGPPQDSSRLYRLSSVHRTRSPPVSTTSRILRRPHHFRDWWRETTP